MADIPVANYGEDGTAVEAAERNAASGDNMPNDGNSVLFANNQDASPTTITIAGTNKCSQGFTHNQDVVVPAGEKKFFGPFPTARFGSRPAISYTSTTSLSVAVGRLGNQQGVS